MVDKMPAGFGFDPAVCEGCRHHEKKSKGIGLFSGSYWACGLCGCPTAEGMPMDRLGMPPEDCPHLREHEGQ